MPRNNGDSMFWIIHEFVTHLIRNREFCVAHRTLPIGPFNPAFQSG